jgi:hypothetical protein
MGKRELLLIGAFALVGLLMYQLTAAPPPPGTRSFSAGGLINHLRRAVRGNQSTAEVVSTTNHPIDASVSEVRLRLGGTVQLTVSGEDRPDVEIQLKVRSNGYDDAEAQRLAKESVGSLRVDVAAGAMIASVIYPQAGRQWPTAVVKVPSRMRVRVEQANAITVSDVSAIDLGPTRGIGTIKNVSGLVSGSHRGGKLTIEHAGAVKLNTRGVEVEVIDVKDLTFSITSGRLNASAVTGTIEIDANQADVKLWKLQGVKGTARINSVGGTVVIDGVRSDCRIDARGSEVEVVVDQAAPLAVYNDGNDPIRLVPPASGGYRIDALARDGKVTPPEMIKQLGLAYATAGDAKEERASGTIGGGGPTLTLRSNHGDIVFKPRAEEPALEKK